MNHSLSYSRHDSEHRMHVPNAGRRVWSWIGLPSTLLLILIAWKVLVSVRGYKAFVLPAPDVVVLRLVQSLGDGFAPGSLLSHSRATLIAALAGFAIALAVSLFLGYLLAHMPRLEGALAPLLAGVQAVPVVAVAPLIVLWIGADMRAKIVVAALVTFFPILSSTIVALRGVPRELRDMAQISGASAWQVLRYIELPLSLPVLFSGIKAGLALATTGAVVGEFVAGREGLGALINISRGLFDTPLMFVALLTLVIITLAFYLIASLLERALVQWEY